MNVGDWWVIWELCERQILPSREQQRFQWAAGDFWISFLNCTMTSPMRKAKTRVEHPTTPNPLSWCFPSPPSPTHEEFHVQTGFFGGIQWSGRCWSSQMMISVWTGISLHLLQLFLISAVLSAQCLELQMISLHVKIPCCVWPGKRGLFISWKHLQGAAAFPILLCWEVSLRFILFNKHHTDRGGGKKIHMENAAVFIYTAQCSNF